MSKLLVETTGEFQLVDIGNNSKLVRHEGYTVVEQSSYLAERVANGQLRIIAELGDGATDEDWVDAVKQSDGDIELARDAFKSEFPVGSTDKKLSAAEKKALAEKEASDKAEREAAEKKAAEAAKAGGGTGDSFKSSDAAKK